MVINVYYSLEVEFMQYYIGTMVFIFGLLIGSFLNVCIYRIPNEKSIVSPPSSCPTCNNRIKGYDLIPVFSYLILGGKCRHCGEKISPRYMLIELLTGLLFLLCFMVVGYTGQLLAFLVLTSVLITITFIDIDYQIIPDPIMIFGLVTGVIFVALGFVPHMGQAFWDNIFSALLGVLCGAGPLIMINLLTNLFIKRDGIGGGDIKLMGVAGLFLGFKNVLLALVLGVVIAGFFAIFYIKKIKSGETDEPKEKGFNVHEIPFGPYLALGCFVSMLFGSEILNWYLGLF